MTETLWSNAAVIQHHYQPDRTRHPVYIMDRDGTHPIYGSEPLPQRHSGSSALFQAIVRQRGYPDAYGARPYDEPHATPSHQRKRESRPSSRAIGRCRVTYPHAPRPPAPPSNPRSEPGRETKTLAHNQFPAPRQPASLRKPSPTPAPRELETVSLLNPTGRFAEKVAAVRRLREFDESIPHEHLPRRRLARKKPRRLLPRLVMLVRCKECEQPWPCHPLRVNLHRTYGENITAKLKELSTKKNRKQADRRSPTAVRHRGWTPRTWYGKPKPE